MFFSFAEVKTKQSRLKLTGNIQNERIGPNVPLSVVVIAMKRPTSLPHPVRFMPLTVEVLGYESREDGRFMSQFYRLRRHRRKC